jgi:putative glutamine amidotransferase
VSGGRFYADAVERAGGLPVVLPPTDSVQVIRSTIDRCDALVLLGGGDVSPTKYAQTERAQLFGVDEFIDDFEISAVKHAIARNIPILAICRGHQVLNVALGGSLVQHLETTEAHRDTMHEVQLVPGSLPALAMSSHSPLVHSFHHQAIDQVADDLTVVGTFHDGTIEAVQHKTARWVVGVQWHPEDTAHDDAPNQGLFNELVKQAQR